MAKKDSPPPSKSAEPNWTPGFRTFLATEETRGRGVRICEGKAWERAQGYEDFAILQKGLFYGFRLHDLAAQAMQLANKPDRTFIEEKTLHETTKAVTRAVNKLKPAHERLELEPDHSHFDMVIEGQYAVLLQALPKIQVLLRRRLKPGVKWVDVLPTFVRQQLEGDVDPIMVKRGGQEELFRDVFNLAALEDHRVSGFLKDFIDSDRPPSEIGHQIVAVINGLQGPKATRAAVTRGRVARAAALAAEEASLKASTRKARKRTKTTAP